MSYDIIETFVTSVSRKLKMASYVPNEDDRQLTSFLPIEMHMTVEPKFHELQHWVEQFEVHVKQIQDDFVLCGYFLNTIKRNGLYRYTSQKS